MPVTIGIAKLVAIAIAVAKPIAIAIAVAAASCGEHQVARHPPGRQVLAI